MTQSQWVDTGDARLRCWVEGQGPVVICAHGFPDCERSFREQLPALVDAGYRVVVPTMRGYGPSSASRQGRYDAEAIGMDLLALADHFAPDAAVRLVGHDWGAVAVYAAAALAPERISQLVTMAVPHLRLAAPRFARPSQLRRSWYMGFFQLRGLAEWHVRRDQMAFVEQLWKRWSPSYDCPVGEMRRIKESLSTDLKAVLAYYRAIPLAVLGRSRRLLFSTMSVPAMYLHGADDGCIGSEICGDLHSAYAAGLDVHHLPGAGHFLHLEEPARVNELLLGFFAKNKP